MNNWYVYLVKCCDGTMYCGISNDVTRRVLAHNLGVGAKYTRGRTPVSLEYVEMKATRSLASVRECEIKRMTRESKLELVRSYQRSLRESYDEHV